MHAALQQYQTVNRDADVLAADRHRLIQLLMDGALSRLAEARGHFARDNKAAFGESIGKVLAIITGLQASLNKEVGGEIAENLDSLYDYMGRTLMKVYVQKDEEPLKEVANLLAEIKEGWDAIADQVA